MLWVEHVVIGFVLAWIFRKRNVRSVIIGSIGPDLFMLPLVIHAGLSQKKWDEMSDSRLAFLVFLPHSFLFLPLVPGEMTLYWSAHIIADIVSHRGKWAIRPLYPLSQWYYEGYYEPWLYLCFQP